jgi:hypothetical protein
MQVRKAFYDDIAEKLEILMSVKEAKDLKELEEYLEKLLKS